jgi:hypothetical protein
MKPLPADPLALHARMMTALCDDIMDPVAMREGTFPRLNAMRAIPSPTERTGAANNRSGDTNGN